MRGSTIRSICLEEYQAFRTLQAIEGYVDLGMFEEAEEELLGLDPIWFALEPIMMLRSRVYAGLNHCE